jgi:hypothetical protein
MVRRKDAAAAAPLSMTSSGGGPVVLLPGDLAARWRGTQAPLGVTPPAGWRWGKKGGPTTDYDRALAPEGFVQTARGGVGFVGVGDGRALVFDGELPTAWLPTDDGGVVVRGLNDDDADAVRASVPDDGWTDVTTLVIGASGMVVLFDAAFAGADDVDAIASDQAPAVGDPGPGTYAVARASVETTDFIRLVRIDGAAKKPTTKKPTTKKPTTKKTATKKPTTKKTATKKPATKKTATKKTAPPAWKTARIQAQEVPRPPVGIEPGFYSFVALPDGSRVGFAGRMPADSVLTQRTATTSRALADVGRFSAFAVHGATVYAGSADGRIVAFPLQDGCAAAIPVGAIDGRVWSVRALPDGGMLVGGPGTVTLFVRDGEAWRPVDTVDVTPNLVPVLDVIDDGRWLVVGRTPKVFVFAVKKTALVLVQVSMQHEGGMLVQDGRAFLYGDGRDVYAYDEVMNLREVYDALG